MLNWFSKRAAHRKPSAPRAQPRLERLEDRALPAISVTPLTALTPLQLVKNLVGASGTVKNIKYTGAKVAAGTFKGGASAIGFPAGVVLTSGDAKNVIGPNKNGGITGSNGTPGDTDLDKIVKPNKTDDASVLEFDYLAGGKTLSFQYVFGSDEYNEFVGSSFNDVFSFYVNGKPVSFIPGTSTAVAINNVNLNKNSKYYVDNPVGSGNRDTEMDGLTKVLPIVAAVTPGQFCHIKLAIADVSDTSLDSAVFIRAGSFSSTSPNIKLARPLRYIYNYHTATFDGQIGVTNLAAFKLGGPVYLLITGLPSGVTVYNSAGKDKSGHPYLKVTTSSIGGHVTLRVPIKFRDAGNHHLGSYFIGFHMQVVNHPIK